MFFKVKFQIAIDLKNKKRWIKLAKKLKKIKKKKKKGNQKNIY